MIIFNFTSKYLNIYVEIWIEEIKQTHLRPGEKVAAFVTFEERF